MDKFNNLINSIKSTFTEGLLTEMPEAVVARSPKQEELQSKLTSIDAPTTKKFGKHELVIDDSGDIYKEEYLTVDGRVYLYCVYNPIKNFGAVIKQIWQDPQARGLAFEYYTNRLLPTYGKIVSDKELTVRGLGMYEKFVEAGYTMQVVDTDTNRVGPINTAEDLSDFFGQDVGNYRFMITDK